MKKWFKILAISSICCLQLTAQLAHYSYEQPLERVTDEWHKIVLPDNVFQSVQQDFSDIRILGVTSTGDTIEAPYILTTSADKISKEQVSYGRINNSKNAKGYYTTFKLNEVLPINKIELDFKTRNYDWKVELAGSMDQEEWFTILSDYRILSIKNGDTDFQYSKLSFPKSTYKYYRLLVPHDFDPGLNTAFISKYIVQPGTYKKQSIQRWDIDKTDKNKNTIVNIKMSTALPISQLSIAVDDEFDYYRPLKIQSLQDSFKTEKGWKYRYRTLGTTTLNSLAESTFDFKSIITDRLRLIVTNGDNQPLNITNVAVRGFDYHLVGRFSQPADYFLTYGNKKARKPDYDIAKFKNKIPRNLNTLKLAAVKNISITPAEKSPLIKSKIWLWLLMGLAALIMGWFTLSMIREKK